jgi:hypothetical protein
MFQSTDGGCPNGENASGTADGLIEGEGSLRRDRVMLGVNLVIFDTFDANGLESAEADMEGDLSGFYSMVVDAS